MDERYTIIVLSENSPGVLHRIADLFIRRKINIESLTVSHTERPGVARFTIVVAGALETLRKVVKQAKRIIEVVDACVCDDRELIAKELAFFKISTENREKRLEIEELVHRYGASCVHAEADSLVVEQTGTEDEINSLYHILEPFGLLEFLKSGRVAIQKHSSPSTDDPEPIIDEGSKGAM